jgi:hypothetical protein
VLGPAAAATARRDRALKTGGALPKGIRVAGQPTNGDAEAT